MTTKKTKTNATRPHHHRLSPEERLKRIREAFELALFPDGSDGVLIRATTGDIAEAPESERLTITIDTGYVEGFHRAKLALHRGQMPAEDVDHKDGDRQNNRLRNLREANAQENARNQRPRKRNDPSMPRGVEKRGRRFRAYVRVDGIKRHLGYFATREEAGNAAEAKRRELFGEFYRQA